MAWVWKFKRGKMHRDESGYILVMSLFVLVILFLIGTTLAIMGIQEFTLSARTKLMDQAYAIADAGVNRAAVALQMNTAWTSGTPPTPYPTVQQGPFTESFGGGQFTWTLYQSDTMPLDPTYKIIRSTGAITKSGRTAERTIETRIVVGAGGEEYDASFDYCMYVGNSDWTGANPPQTPPPWPYEAQTGFGGIVSGDYTFDGATPYPDAATGKYPRGAIYVKGKLNVPVLLLGNLIYKGNVVATDDVAMKSSWTVGWSQPGITIASDGKVIAGVDPVHGGNGDITVDVAANTTVGNATFKVDGQLIAARDVNLDASANISFTAATVVINGIKCGRDMYFKGTANLSRALQLGPIVAGRKVTIESRWLNGVSVNSIWSGQDTGTGNGVFLRTYAASRISTGSIITRGRVSAEATLAGITLGSVTAGNSNAGNLGGTGVYFNMGAAGCSTGDIISLGMIDLNASWLGNISTGAMWAGTDSASGSGGTGVQCRGSALASVNTNGGMVASVGSVIFNGSAGGNWTSGMIWSNNNVDLNAGELWIASDKITTGEIQAKGYVNVRSGDDISIGAVTSEKWVGIRSSDKIDVWGNIYAGTGGGIGGYAIYCSSRDFIGGLGNQNRVYGTMQARGSILHESSARVSEADSRVNGGLWGDYVRLVRNDFGDISDTELKIGKIPGAGNDSIRSTGNVYAHGAGDWFDDDIFMSDVRVRPTSSIDFQDVSWGSRINDANLQLPVTPTINPVPLPGKPNPVYVDKNGVLDEPGPGGQIKNVDVLYEANLSAPVNLLKPNWHYFETMAEKDDAANSAAPHRIFDGGPGDSDGMVNGVIQFVWDTSKPYSTRETVYSGDPSVRVEIKSLDWSNQNGAQGAAFEGTVVSQGDVTITAPNSAWFMKTWQVLNVVSGNNITCSTSGLTLWENNNSQFHFWADHDIDMSNLRFSLGGGQTYFGSFTAGNRIHIADNSFYPNCTFRWSRWALDPVAWAPPFKVLTWKEI